MGRLEDRVRKLEEKVERGGYAAAFSQATDEDIFALADAARKAQQADEAGEPGPSLTREEFEAQARVLALREKAIRAGWGTDAYRIV